MGIAYIDNVQFRHQLGQSDLANVGHRLENGRAITWKLRKVLAAALEANSGAEIDRARQQLLGHPDIKLAAVIRANKQIPPKRRWTIEQCVNEADTLNLYLTDSEVVRVWLKPKAHGFRVIQAFGPRRKAAQFMLGPILDTCFHPLPYQFTLRGYHSAIAATKKLISAGNTRFFHVDIKDHFGSFRQAKLTHELPLPDGVVENVVLTKGDNLVWAEWFAHSYKGAHTLPKDTPGLESALLGLPQGSSCAPLVAAICLSRVGWQKPVGVEVVNFADNFCLFGVSEKVLAEAAEALQIALAEAPGGSFKLVVKGEGTASQGLDFLGHRLRFEGAELRTEPLESAYSSLCADLAPLDERLQKIAYLAGGKHIKIKAGALHLLARYVSVLQGWKSAYRECENLQGWFLAFEESAAGWMKAVGVSACEVTAAISPDMKYEPDIAGGY